MKLFLFTEFSLSKIIFRLCGAVWGIFLGEEIILMMIFLGEKILIFDEEKNFHLEKNGNRVWL